MNKKIAIKLFSGLFLSLLAIGNLFAQEVKNDNSRILKVLVVYYSRTGHTKLIAEHLAKKFNADLEELVDKHKRTGPFGFTSAGKDAIAHNLTTLAPFKHNINDYDIVIIGGPAWVGNITPAVRTFIMQNDLTGKKIGLFGVCHINGVESALNEATDLLAKGSTKKFPILPLREAELKDEVLSKKIDAFYKEVELTKSR